MKHSDNKQSGPRGFPPGPVSFWQESRAAMVEPEATDTDYRRRGLGRSAVLEDIRRCVRLGATVAYAGSRQESRLSFGLKSIFGLNDWTRKW